MKEGGKRYIAVISITNVQDFVYILLLAAEWEKFGKLMCI
jgi:hypothetical protein